MLAYRFIWAFFMLAVAVPAALHVSDASAFMSVTESAGYVDMPFYFSHLSWAPHWLHNVFWHIDGAWVMLISMVSQAFPQSAVVASLKDQWMFLFWLFALAALVQPPFYNSDKAWGKGNEKSIHDMTAEDYLK